MPKPTDDFRFLTQVLDSFFAKRNVRSKLATIREQQVKGWEKWLQIELAIFLMQNSKVRTWNRESQFELDPELAKTKRRCAIDFIIHQKRKHTYLALELKQFDSKSTCASGMLKDIKKLLKILNSKSIIRSMWSLGIHDITPSTAMNETLHKYADNLGVVISNKLILTKPIGTTGYSFTLLTASTK